MPIEVRHSPPPLHQPSHSDVRPRGILKNPSFSGESGRHISPEKTVEHTSQPSSEHLDPQSDKDITLQNTLQNAGHRRSSSSARRASASRRHSSAAGITDAENPDNARLQWDEANLYLAEQDRGSRMKITEPKTPYQFGDGGAMEEEEEEDVAIDPRYVNVDEVEMQKKKSNKSTAKKARESDIPGLDIGEPEEEGGNAAGDSAMMNDDDAARIVRSGSASSEKHVSTENVQEQVGMPTREEQEKHRQFEAQRKRHYEMRDVKGLLGHSEEADGDEDMSSLPSRGVNGTR